eukprot:Nk52_evm1s967 gene=Nk52_evmTU1s967
MDMISIDRYGVLREIGAKTLEILGYEKEDLQGKHISVLWPSFNGAGQGQDNAEALGGLSTPSSDSHKNTKKPELIDFTSASPVIATKCKGGARVVEVGLTEILDLGDDGFVVFLRDCSDISLVRRVNPFVGDNYAVLLISDCGKIQFAPDFGLTLFDLSSNELVGNAFMKYVCDRDMSYYLRKMRDLFENGVTVMNLSLLRKEEVVEVELWGKVDRETNTALCLIGDAKELDPTCSSYRGVFAACTTTGKQEQASRVASGVGEEDCFVPTVGNGSSSGGEDSVRSETSSSSSGAHKKIEEIVPGMYPSRTVDEHYSLSDDSDSSNELAINGFLEKSSRFTSELIKALTDDDSYFQQVMKFLRFLREYVEGMASHACATAVSLSQYAFTVASAYTPLPASPQKWLRYGILSKSPATASHPKTD